VEDFATDGRVKLGSLYQYRKFEGLTAGQSDSMEGTTQYQVQGPVDSSSARKVTDFLRRELGIVGGSIRNLSGGPAVIHEKLWPDCYLFCMTEEPKDQLLSDFGGACVEIGEPIQFLRRINDELLKRSLVHPGSTAIGRCIYRPKKRAFDDLQQEAPGFLVKPEKYAYQLEWRAMWRRQRKVISGARRSPATTTSQSSCRSRRFCIVRTCRASANCDGSNNAG
jgi:hypothetical protein